jgi:hypothetical protein
MLDGQGNEVYLVQLAIVIISVTIVMLVILEMKHRWYIKHFGEPARKMFEEDGVL